MHESNMRFDVLDKFSEIESQSPYWTLSYPAKFLKCSKNTTEVVDGDTPQVVPQPRSQTSEQV